MPRIKGHKKLGKQLKRHLPPDVLKGISLEHNFSCDQRWEDMQGDAKSRVCAACDRCVYNLLEMTGEEVKAVIDSEGSDFCGQFYLRDDGAVSLHACEGAVMERGNLFAQVPDSSE